MPWLTVQQAAAEMELSERSVRRRVREGRLPSRLDDKGRTVVEVATASQSPARQLSATAAAMTGQVRLVTDQHERATDALAAAGTRIGQQLATVEKRARTNARAAILMTGIAVACLAGAGTGYHVLTDRHRDGLDAVHAETRDHMSAAEAAHRTALHNVVGDFATELTTIRDDHQTVVLELTRRAATSDGIASARANELTRAAERLGAVTRGRDESLADVKRLKAAARGERPDGTPIMLAAEPE